MKMRLPYTGLRVLGEIRYDAIALADEATYEQRKRIPLFLFFAARKS
jgi:hypothetical protein